jgi:hypothetical protein
MNNTYSLFVNHRFAAYKYRNALMPDAFLLRFVIFFFLACASLCGTNAHSTPVCIPQGFDIFPTMPATISLGKINYAGGDKLLYESSVTANATGACSNLPNATLDFVTFPTSIFTDTVAPFILAPSTAAKVTMVYSSRSTFSTPSPAYYTMLFYYYITVSCTGSTITAQIINTDTFRVTGLQSCSGYTVNYKVSIYQNDAYVPTGNYTTAVESRGIRVRANLLDDRTGTLATANTALSSIGGSVGLRFISGAYCSYSLSTSTLYLGTLSDLDILKLDTSRPYTINIQNCQNATGRQVSVFWRFANPHPSDSSLMLNSAAGGASGVGARTYCSGLVARHNEQLQMTASLQGNLSIACYGILDPAPGVSNAWQIRPGAFSGVAYLVFQFQ